MRFFPLASLALSLAACSISAPPAEDFSGEALKVEGGVLEIDDDVVPVVDACASGQLVARNNAADGWECVDVVASSVTAGDGLVGGGAGEVNLAVDFGDGATQVASGERAAAAEADIETLTTTGADHEIRIGDLEARALTDLFTADCDAAAEGGLNFAAGALQVCDGAQFREVQLAPLPPPLVIADFDFPNLAGNTWPSSVGTAALHLGQNAGVVSSAGPPVVQGVGSQGAATSSRVAATRLALPERDFSVELTVINSGELIQHGGGLRINFFGPDFEVHEHGGNARYTPNPAVDSAQPVHLVYVHETDDTRRLFVNGAEATRNPDSSQSTGPYLGGDAVFALGSLFGAAGGAGLIYRRVVIHGHALDASEVAAACAGTGVNVPGC